ncbi:MAG: 4Fe-4S iron sulfur cluster binding protein, NifH/frxC family [Candidatus Nanosalina sp. J07AB43]|nr:MAG: 4Fe-4S iron sulfur cluster binding protein, NifH/frxC family [Candidatus Nanosalina sp. J07AB43]
MTNTLGAKELADQKDRDVIGLVLNEVRDEKHEVEHEDITELVGEDVIGRVPDHEHVREAIALRNPVVSYKPDSRASHAIEDVAYKMRGEEPPERGLGTKIRYKMDEIDLI